MKKTLTFDGKRYTVTQRKHFVVSTAGEHDILDIRGHGVNSAIYGTIDAPNLREIVKAAIERDRENHRLASEKLQERIARGEAGLGR